MVNAQMVIGYCPAILRVLTAIGLQTLTGVSAVS
jgi:hypothetical protein